MLSKSPLVWHQLKKAVEDLERFTVSHLKITLITESIKCTMFGTMHFMSNVELSVEA